MASNSRQTKTQRKGAAADAARRPSAWSGARASPTFSPTSSSPRPTNPASSQGGNFPPLGQTNGNRQDTSHDRVIQALSGLTGTTITLSTKTGQRYEGVISSTNNEGDTTGVTLKDVKEISNPGGPLKDQLFVASTNIETWASGPADAKMTNGDSFRTDSDISQKKLGGTERELQAWQAPVDAPASSQIVGGLGDDVTFGPGSSNGSWDQFSVNEKLFGIRASFDEDLYTTKLDRTAADFKERERKAQKIANEIINSTSSNPHIAEERGQTVDDSGINEEDKYGAVVRGVNAYIPPGARKAGAVSVASNASKAADVPKVSVNGPDGTAVQSTTESPGSSSKAPSPAPSGSNKPPADPLPAFRDFVTNEKQRLTQKRQALVKSEMDKRMAELVKFSQSFKLNKPIPDDLVPILAKDEDKQRQIKEKSTKDATSSQARNIGPSTSHAVPARGPQLTSAKIVEATRKPSATPASNAAAQKSTGTTSKTETAKPSKPVMYIQPIPPFKGSKGKTAAPGANGAAAPASASSQSPAKPPTPSTGAANANAAARLNVNASSFRPNPKANAFTPGVASPSTSNQPLASASSSPKPKEAGPVPPNPFFGTRPIKKSPPVNVKDDFSPFKTGKVTDPHTVGSLWPYSGKRYMQMFPTPPQPPQQHSPHMVPPVPPPMPPPSYEEDSAAQAAARGYMQYPHYYPGQWMPGMPPPGPPGAFMPSPYMQAMPYPPGMPPPNAMYGPPGMGQMPPPQAYMPPPPPPGTYPPPPNGAGPRPSMPPTPIPAHAHPYYQSPQLQHAVPYPMMMPPPPNVPHPYEGAPAPPVQMGGHA
ncbi:pab1 binding protein [Moniliophthora roreri]|uniref:LsmAD domain-containing protein n=1 Tax=Moniliophthora roreri TaxID=221103 RepID=A0A0W0EZM8_MONRR|nr:pab1 binding protein [Moniliophthora roreri]